MHTSESLNTNERLLQPAPIDYDPVISLAVSPFEADLAFLQRMFDDADWKLFTAHTYKKGMAQLSRELIPVMLCECQLPDGNWKDILSRLAPMLEPPRLIAVSHHADERLWLEVLDLGSFDLLATPFREVEAGYAIGTAWLDWKYARYQVALQTPYQRSDDGWRECMRGLGAVGSADRVEEEARISVESQRFSTPIGYATASPFVIGFLKEH